MIKFSVRKPLTVFVAVLAIIILGIVAVTRMTPDLFPNMDFPYVIVVATYPGASPEAVEEEVTRPMEQSMATLDHIQEITSTSSENYSLVILEFEDSVNMDTIGVDIQQKLSALEAEWDDGVGTPYMMKINPSMLPVNVAAVSYSGKDIIELSDFTEETLLPALEGVSGVASVTAVGSVERQVHVVIDSEKIDALNERLAASINDKLDETQTELEDTRSELEDAQQQLEDAQQELEEGKDTLVTETSAAQATITEQQSELMNTKLELQLQLDTLEETKSTLEQSIGTLETLLGTLWQLEDKQAALEADRAEAESKLAALEQAKTEMETADDALAVFTAQLEAIETDETLTPEEKDAQTAAIYDSGEYAAAVDAVNAAEQSLADLGTDRYGLTAAIWTAKATITELELEQAAADTALAAVDTALAAVGTDRDSVNGKYTEAVNGLSEVNAGIDTINSALTQLDSGTLQLSEAQATLSATTSSGLLQIAEAASEIAINTATVDSALTQVNDGLDTLADSREDALEQADLSGSITMENVAAILGAQNFAMPAGYVDVDGTQTMVSVGDEITDPDELGDLLLFDTGEDGIGKIYLRDVADIYITDNSDESYAQLDGSDGIILTFEKQSNAATAEVCDNLAETFAELEEKYPGLEFVSLMDQGDYISMILKSILSSLLTGALFAIIILYLFLRDIRPTVITLVAIPVSVIFAVVLMYFTGVTLNLISLSGLAVAVGMLVDNSIVVIENIYRLRAKGATIVQAAVAGTKQVAGAVTASTLTTVCVFLPIVFVEGLTKQLFTDLALTMTYSLMASLVIALTLVPSMSIGMLKKETKRNLAQREKGEGAFLRGYRKIVAWSLNHKWAVLLPATALLVVTAWGAISRGFSYIPDIDMNTVSVTVTMPEGALREEAVAFSNEVLSRIETLNGIDNIGAMMGSSTVLSDGGDYDLTVYVMLPEGESGAALGDEIEALCEDLGCEVSCSSALFDMSLLTGSGITLNIYGDDIEALQSTAEKAAELLAGVDGVTTVDSGLENVSPALHVSVDRNAAMEKGYTVAQLYMEIATRLTDSATVMSLDVEATTADVTVETDSAVTREELEAMRFDYTDSDGEEATFLLGDVAEVEETVSMSSIGRSGQRRMMSVTAEISDDYNVTKVTTAAERVIEQKLDAPEGITTAFGGENETIMDAVRQLGLMLLLGIVLVYFVMVAQFQSLKSPFIVMFTIPLAFTGGFAALLICGLDVSILSIIGFVMLVGIIVNNGIVLIDYVNQLRSDGMERREALIEAGATRMRPILMTTLTTILGLVVMALGRDAGTAMMQSVAVVCIGGLLYATAMTLLVVPCIYDMMNRKDVHILSDEELEYEES